MFPINGAGFQFDNILEEIEVLQEGISIECRLFLSLNPSVQMC